MEVVEMRNVPREPGYRACWPATSSGGCSRMFTAVAAAFAEAQVCRSGRQQNAPVSLVSHKNTGTRGL